MTDPDIVTVLRRWWTKKYKLPVSSQEWQNSYFEDLFVEFYEDLMEKDKEFSKELRAKYTGMEMSPSGDSVTDMWERQIAHGETPDLSYGDTPEEVRQRQAMEEYLTKRYLEQGIPWWEPVKKGVVIGGKVRKESDVDLYGYSQVPGDITQMTPDELAAKGFSFPDDPYGQDLEDLDFRDMANSDQLPMEVMESIESMSGEAFDEFMNAVGGFRK